MATLSVKNVNKRSPLSFVRLKRVLNIVLIPTTVLTLKAVWHGSDVLLNQVLVIVTVTIPGLLEATGMLLADEPLEINASDVESVDVNKNI